MKGPLINLHFPCWRWGFPSVFFSPEKRGWFQNPWHGTMTIDRPQGPAGRLWKVNYLECDMEVTGGSKGKRGGPSFGEDETEGFSPQTVAFGADIFVQSLDLMDMNSHLIFAIWQIGPWSFFSLPLKDDLVIFIEYGYVWVLFKYTLKMNGWNLKITQLKKNIIFHPHCWMPCSGVMKLLYPIFGGIFHQQHCCRSCWGAHFTGFLCTKLGVGRLTPDATHPVAWICRSRSWLLDFRPSVQAGCWENMPVGKHLDSKDLETDASRRMSFLALYICTVHAYTYIHIIYV